MFSERNQRFGQQLRSAAPCFLMEAHSGISARIAEEEGFEAIWASGLAISTALGVRDCSEVTWSELLTVVEQMVQACKVPVIVDGDSGYGDFNTARRVSAAAERLGAAGICFEDKKFPKMNSFINGDHALAPVAEFAGKLSACVDAKVDPTFSLIARTETLIAGGSIEEAVHRARVYHQAGADAVFIHSRKHTFDEVEMVATQIGRDVPIVIAPTTYAHTPLEAFEQAGISAIIWANHSMRAAIAGMQEVCRELRTKKCAGSIETQISSLDNIFELLDYRQLLEDELRYQGGETSAVKAATS